MSIAPPGHPAPPLYPERPQGAPPPPNRATWTPAVALFGGLGIFIGALMFAVIPQAIGIALGDDANNLSSGTVFASIVVQDGAIVAAVWAVVRSNARNPLSALGLRPTKFWVALGWAAVVFASYLVFAGIYSQLVNSPEQDIVEELNANSTLAVIAICFGACVVAPIAEETLFRGFIFGGLRQWRGFWPAALISGGLFGCAHVLGSPIAALPQLAILGFGLAAIYQLTDSLWPCIYLHSFNNCMAMSVALNLEWEWTLVFAGGLSAIYLVQRLVNTHGMMRAQ